MIPDEPMMICDSSAILRASALFTAHIVYFHCNLYFMNINKDLFRTNTQYRTSAGALELLESSVLESHSVRGVNLTQIVFSGVQKSQ